MGNNLWLRFMHNAREGSEKLEKEMLENLLTAIASDLYSRAELKAFSQRILTAVMSSNEKIGRIEIIVRSLYCFGVYASENKEEVGVSFVVDECNILNERVMSDFAKRARKAFDVLKPWYGYAETDESIDAFREAYGLDVKPDAHLCWINYYSPDLVDKIGRDKILSAARTTARELGDVTIDELVDGAITLQVGKMPGYIENIPKIKAMEKALFERPCKYDAKRV